MIRKIFSRETGGGQFSLRRSNICLSLLVAGLILLGLMFTHAFFQRRSDAPMIARIAGIAAKLELTDLCLFTEARYARHLSQADLHSAFQDHPLALEHFPAGSVAGPPASIRRPDGGLD